MAVKHSPRKRGVMLTPEGQRKLQAARQQAECADNFGDRYTLEELSERTGLSLKTITKVLDARNTVDRPTLEAFFQAFQISLERSDYRYPSENLDLQPSTAFATEVLQDLNNKPVAQINWGEAPDVSMFYGRQDELAQLKQWLDRRNGQSRRLIAVLGMGGVGKTTLATKLLHEVASDEECCFKFVIWRSLRNAPTLDTILTQWLSILSNHQDRQPSLQRLLHYLRRDRCLLVLDNLETILSGTAGVYRPGYEAYGELFRLIGETPHQSSLIVTSREKTIELSTLEGEHFPVCCLSLKGSDEASLYLVQAKQLKGTAEQQKQLCDRYSNSPLAVKIISATIQDLFDGDIGAFLQEEAVVFHGIRRLLDQQFERLSDLEQAIMFWLAVNRTWTTIDELSTDLLPTAPRSKLLEAIESLHWRSLIEKKQGTYTQQPIVMEYVTERLVERISAELVRMKEQPPILLHRCASLKTTVKDYIRNSQKRLILEAIARELQATLGSCAAIAQHLKACLTSLRSTTTDMKGEVEPSYAAGNILNLLCHLGVDLTGCNCSGLAVWHAYLPNVPLPHSNFAYADLQRSQLTDTFGAVFAVAFSPDGTHFVTGEIGGYLRRWRISDGQAMWMVKACNSRIHSVAISPDNAIIAVGTGDAIISVWEVATGNLVRSLLGHDDQVHSVTFHPTAPLLASASSDGTIRLWHSQTGDCLSVFAGKDGHTDQAQSVCFSPKGNYLISGSSDRTIKIWDLNTKTLHQTLTGHEDQVYSINIHPQEEWLASGSPDGTIKLWQIDANTFTATLVRTLDAHTSHIFSVQFSPDGSLLASSCADQTIRLWDSQTGQPLHTLQAHSDWIRALQFSPDGQTLLSGCTDYTIKLWDVDTGHLLRTWSGYSNWIWAVDISQDGTKLVSGGGDRTVRIWDRATGTCLQTLRGHPNWVLAVACNDDCSLIASGGTSQSVIIWQTSSGKPIKILKGHTSQVLYLQFSPDNTILASSNGDYSVRLWEVASGQLLHALRGHQDWVRFADFSPDGSMLVSAGQDLTVKLWDVRTGECLRTWQDFDTWVWGASFHPDGDRFLTAAGNILKLWDVNTGSLIKTYEGHTQRIRKVVMSPKGTCFASGGQDNLIHLWQLETGKILNTFLGHTEQVLSLKFSPDGRYLVSGSADETIKIWDVETRELHQTLKAEGLYEGMNIAGMTGLSEEAIATLIKLGAAEDS